MRLLNPGKLCTTLTALQNRHHVSMYYTPYTNVYMGPRFQYEWSPVKYSNRIPRIMDSYFGTDVGVENKCDLFLIEGVPAASIIYDKKGNQTIIKELHINRPMFLLFDAWSYMRKELYKHHSQINTDNIKNKNDLYLM